MISSLNLRTRIRRDRQAARKAQDALRSAALGNLWAGICQMEVDEQVPALEDEQVIQILMRCFKQCEDALMQAEQVNRVDLIKQAQYERSVIQAYLPMDASS